MLKNKCSYAVYEFITLQLCFWISKLHSWQTRQPQRAKMLRVTRFLYAVQLSPFSNYHHHHLMSLHLLYHSVYSPNQRCSPHLPSTRLMLFPSSCEQHEGKSWCCKHSRYTHNCFLLKPLMWLRGAVHVQWACVCVMQLVSGWWGMMGGGFESLTKKVLQLQKKLY